MTDKEIEENVRRFFDRKFRDKCVKDGIIKEKNGRYFLVSNGEQINWKFNDEDTISKS